MDNTRNIFLVGPMGTGKSTVGRLLASELSRPFFDSDHEIEARCGCDIPWIFDVEGEPGFRRRESHVIESLSEHQGIVLATGGGAILNESNRMWLRERGIVIFLRASIEQQLRRTARDRHRPLLQCDDPAAKLHALYTQREPLYREVAHWVVSTERRGPRAVVNEIKRRIRQ